MSRRKKKEGEAKRRSLSLTRALHLESRFLAPFLRAPSAAAGAAHSKARFLIGGTGIQPVEKKAGARLRSEEKKKESSQKKRSKPHLANARGAEEAEADAATREDDANSIWLAIVG